MFHRFQSLGLVCALLLCLSCERDTPAPETPSEIGVSEQLDEPLAEDSVDSALDEASAPPLGGHVSDRYPASLETVVEKRFLRVLTSRNAFDFFIHHGEPGGYQYEMVRDFTRFLNRRHVQGRSALPIQFELIPVDDDQLVPLLLDGAGDMIAARLTKTPERAEVLRFSVPYREVDELVVTHDETPPIESIEDLSGRNVAVRGSSSYRASLIRLNDELTAAGLEPVEIELVDQRLETERILELVAARRFPYTIADSIVAAIAVRIHPGLRVVEGIALRRGGELAWATQPGATSLVDEMNAFLGRYEQGSLLGNIALQKYFESEGDVAERIADTGVKTLSDYDDLFRRYAAEFGLDWRLVAAMAYQESRFDPRARNRSSAVGLLQIKPSTAREPYVDIPDVEGPEHVGENVEAGLKYLTWIKARYFETTPDMRERDRVRMALAAYNAGPRTIINARRRADKLGLDSNRWFRNVELALLDMRKTEPVNYVSQINQRYLAYILLGVE